MKHRRPDLGLKKELKEERTRGMKRPTRGLCKRVFFFFAGGNAKKSSKCEREEARGLGGMKVQALERKRG